MTVLRDAAPFRVRWGNLAPAIFIAVTVMQAKGIETVVNVPLGYEVR
jgi:hypothetical protein